MSAPAVGVTGNSLAMYGCSEIHKLLHPSLDRELDINESLRVQTHLKDCGPCRERLLDDQEFLALLRSLVVSTPAPDTLRQTVRDALSREVHRLDLNKRRWRELVSPGMLAAVAVLLALFFAIPRPQIPPLVKTALAQHRRYMKDPAFLQIKGNDVQTVTHALQRQLPFPLHLPPTTTAAIHLIGADVRTDPLPSAVLAYQVADSPVSLLVTTPRDIHLSNTATQSFQNTLFHSAFIERLHVLQWSDHRHSYVLVACRDTPPDTLPFAVLTADGSSAELKGAR